MGDGHHVHSDGAWLRVLGRRHGLAQPQDPGLACVELDGVELLHRGRVTTCSSNGCGARSSMRRSTCVPTSPYRMHVTLSLSTSTFTMQSGRTAVLRAALPMRCTSTGSHYLWPPNPLQKFHLSSQGNLFKRMEPALFQPWQPLRICSRCRFFPFQQAARAVASSNALLTLVTSMLSANGLIQSYLGCQPYPAFQFRLLCFLDFLFAHCLKIQTGLSKLIVPLNGPPTHAASLVSWNV